MTTNPWMPFNTAIRAEWFRHAKGFLMARREEEALSWMISFSCWNCKEESEVDLKKAQEDRVEGGMYGTIEPNPKNRHQYYIKCPACDRFNTIHF